MELKKIENNNLKNNIQKLKFKSNEQILDNIFYELKNSIFIVPKNKENYLTLQYGNSNMDYVIPLFTDYNEIPKNDNNKYGYEIVSIDYFIEIAQLDVFFNGILINPYTQKYHISNELLKILNENQFSYSLEQLKQISQNTDNLELIEVIKKQENKQQKEIPLDIVNALSNSILFSLVTSEITLDDHLENGATDITYHPEHQKDLSLLITNTDIGDCLILLTDKNQIHTLKTELNSSDPQKYIYSKIANISQLCIEILNNNLDGIIINPHTNSYILSKEAVNNSYNSIKQLSQDPTLIKSNSCIFDIK